MDRATTDVPTFAACGATGMGQSAAAREPAGTDGGGRWSDPLVRQLAAIAAVQVLVMATWFSASAVVPALRAEWAARPRWRRVADGVGPARLRHRRLTAAVLNLADRVPAHRLVAVCALARGRRDGLRRGVRRRPRGGGAAAVPHRRRPRGGLPDRPEAHDVVVRPRTRVRPRRAGRRPDAGQRAPPADQRASPRCRGGRCCWWRRRAPRRAACSRRASSGPARWPRPPRRSGRGTCWPCSASGARGWRTSATSGTCGSCTRCGRGSPPTLRRAPRPPVTPLPVGVAAFLAIGVAGVAGLPARRLAGRPGRAGAAGGAGDGGERHLLRRWPRSPSAARRSWCWRWCSSGARP